MNPNGDLRPKRAFIIDPNALCGYKYASGLRCRGIRIKGTELCPGHTEGMQCNFKLESGKRCWLRAGKGEVFCGLHQEDKPKAAKAVEPEKSVEVIRAKNFVIPSAPGALLSGYIHDVEDIKKADGLTEADYRDSSKRVRLSKKAVMALYADVAEILPFYAFKRASSINTPCFLVSDFQKFVCGDGEYTTSWKRRMIGAAELKDGTHFINKKNHAYISFGGAKRILKMFLGMGINLGRDLAEKYDRLLKAITSRPIPEASAKLPVPVMEPVKEPEIQKPIKPANGPASVIIDRVIDNAMHIANGAVEREREASAANTQVLIELRAINRNLLRLLEVWGA